MADQLFQTYASKFDKDLVDYIGWAADYSKEILLYSAAAMQWLVGSKAIQQAKSSLVENRLIDDGIKIYSAALRVTCKKTKGSASISDPSS